MSARALRPSDPSPHPQGCRLPALPSNQLPASFLTHLQDSALPPRELAAPLSGLGQGQA